jgi:hypothetical protein
VVGEGVPRLLDAVIAATSKGLFMGLILFIVLVLLLVGVFPAWPHSRKWGYYPTGGLSLLVIVLLILIVSGVIPRGFS